jgi:hypothetical protein
MLQDILVCFEFCFDKFRNLPMKEKKKEAYLIICALKGTQIDRDVAQRFHLLSQSKFRA